MQPQDLTNRIRKNLKRQKKWAKKGGFEAFRVYDKDIPEIPFTVDLYGQNAVLFDKRKKHQYLEDETSETLLLGSIIQAVAEALEIKERSIRYKKRQRMEGDSQYEKIESTGHRFQIKEGSVTFLVNLDDYLDTGLFLDHRPIRQRIIELQSKSFLNLFSYTGTVSVCAAIAGAKVTSIDISNTYLDWSKENFKANSIDLTQHEFVRANILEYLQRDNAEVKYDTIFLDPPTFSNSKKMRESFDIQRDHLELIRRCMNRTTPDGLLIFSCNKRGFKLDENLQRNYQIKDITTASIPEDFRDKKIHSCYEIKRK